MDLPGRVKWSWGFLGDESLEFARHTREYLESRIASCGSIFLGRIVNKPTVFVTSNTGAQELLQEKWKNFSLGYKEYFYELFDESLPFIEGDLWESTHEVLAKTFSHDKGPQFQDQCERIIQSYFTDLDISKPVVVYEIFKELATQLCVFMFLGIDPSDPLSREISELMTIHWRGIISIPVNVKLPLLSLRSGYGKALEAKKRLIEIIRENFRRSMVSKAMDGNGALNEGEVEANILVYLSALIPKAFSSILTTLVLELCKVDQERLVRECLRDSEVLRNVIYEAERLWPPLMGGFRIAQRECTLGGYRVPQGYYVCYISFFANRDGAVFREPNQFIPERWSGENCQDVDKLCTFGGGPRSCVGKYLAQHLLQGCAKSFLESFKFRLVEGQDLSYKMLPISRPREDVEVHLTRLSKESDKDSSR